MNQRSTKSTAVLDDLRTKIRTGRLAAGEQLPSTRHLADEYGVSEETIRLVIKALKASGDVDARWGKGVFVRTPRQLVVRESQLRYAWEKERAQLAEAERAQSGVSEYDTGRARDDFDFPAEFDRTEADDRLAEIFGVPERTALLERRYRTTVRGEEHPIAMIKSYLVYDVAAQNPDLLDPDKEPWPGGTMHQLLTIGIEIDRITDEIGTRSPTPEEQNILGLPEQIPVFILNKTSFSTDGNVVEHSDVVLPGDRTRMRYTVELKAWTS